jgi:hypothetical protein
MKWRFSINSLASAVPEIETAIKVVSIERIGHKSTIVFTSTCVACSLVRAKIDGHGLWTVSRGFARNRDAYLAALAGADEHRRGDLDGRGNLSNQGL